MEPSLPVQLEPQPTIPPSTDSGLRRSMGARHLVMIAMGGVIGSGLFLSSGYTISQAGPLGAVIAYLIGAFVVYLVMACLGELAIAYPVSGAFHIYAARSIGPATGFTTAWLYWLCWAVAIGSEFTASGLLMQRWFPGVDVWVWCLIFASVLFGFNAVSSKFFGESEFWFAIVKVGAIVVLIVFGGAALFGFHPLSEAASHPSSCLKTSTLPAVSSPTASRVSWSLRLRCSTPSRVQSSSVWRRAKPLTPATSIPKAMRSTVIRLLIFFVGAIAVIAATIPFEQVGLDESPFVTVFSSIGIPYAADIMNFVIITALLSAGNSGLFSCARMLYSLADEGHAPRALKKLTRRGIPMTALSVSMLGGLASLISSVVAPETVYLALVSVAGFAVVGVWMSITASHFFHRRSFVKNGGDVAALPYKAPLFPLVPILAFSLCVISLIGIAYDPNQVAALYFGFTFVGACYAFFYFKYGRKARANQTS